MNEKQDISDTEHAIRKEAEIKFGTTYSSYGMEKEWFMTIRIDGKRYGCSVNFNLNEAEGFDVLQARINQMVYETIREAVEEEVVGEYFRFSSP